MKMTLVLLMLTIVQLWATESFSQSEKISLKLENVKISDALDKIENQSGLYFFYNSKLIDVERKVNINTENEPISEILADMFGNDIVKFVVHDRQVVLVPKEGSSNEELFQQKLVSGIVTDENGNPIPGVTVLVKGTTTGTLTDATGKYSLVDAPQNATLVFSFVGMLTQEIPLSGRTLIDVVLKEDAVGLNEVVVIGYGTIRKKDLTGSVVSVGAATLKSIPVTSAAQAITGQMAGVQVTKTEGSPDAEIKIRVRGGGSITQDNSPLYVVDGFPVDNINDIAPTEIQSIDVLKDASSTAIYGARGANGVVLITTKRGFAGVGKVSYNTYFGIKKNTKTLDVLDPYEYTLLQFQIPNTTKDKKFGNFGDIDLYKQMRGTNWQDEVFGRTGTSMYHNLAFTGGSETSNYNISLTRNDEEEIMIGSGYTRTNLLIKTFHKVNNWLAIDLNTRLSDNNLKGAGTSSNSRLISALQYRPVNGLTDFVDYDLTDADYEIVTTYTYNPVDQTNDDYKRANIQTYNFNGAATIKFSKNLSYRFGYVTQYNKNTDKQFYGLNTSNIYAYGRQPMASIIKTDSKTFLLSNVLTYNKKDFLPGHNVNAVLGEELNSRKSEVITSSAKYFPQYIDAVSALSMMSLGTADAIQTSNNTSNNLSSFFGRINYNYRGKYLASVTLRADGSSKFAPGNQWGYFPSAALAWRMSEENFMKGMALWLNNLKLRASYGGSGNNRISDDAWKKTFFVTSTRLFLNGDGGSASPTPYLQPNNILSNPDLKWETTVTRNAGLDFDMFKQRLSGSVEVYKNTTKDLLIMATIPSNTGYTVQWQNIGQTSNRGLEIVLRGVIVEQKDFSLSMSFNIGFNRNKIDKLGATKRWEQTSGFSTITNDYLIEEGGKVGLMYGYETEGMYSVDDFDYNGSTGKYTLKTGVADDSKLIVPITFLPGTLKLVDQDSDLVVNAAKDRVVIGDANPKHTGGFSLTAQYKGFDFSAFFNWVYGNDIYNANKLFFTCTGWRQYSNLLSIMNSDNSYTYIDKVTGQESVTDPVRLAEMNKNATIWSSLYTNPVLFSWCIEDGSFLRLNNMTVGYSLPKNILNKLRINQLRIYATAYNLWLWTNYSGFDPEVDTKRSTPLTPGVDWCAYPRSRSFNVGLNIEF